MALHHTGILRILMVLGGALLLTGMFTNGSQAGEEALLTRLSAASAELESTPDFSHAHAENGTLTLTWPDATLIQLPLTGALSVFRDDVVYAWKSGGDVYYITGGAVDDVWGYVLTRDRTLSLGEIKTLRALSDASGYRCYAFSTLRDE